MQYPPAPLEWVPPKGGTSPTRDLVGDLPFPAGADEGGGKEGGCDGKPEDEVANPHYLGLLEDGD